MFLLLKVSAVLFFFYMCYCLFLQRETIFDANFKWMVYSPKPFHSDELEPILQHKKVQATQLDRLDILLRELMTVVFWYHPWMRLYRQALKQNLGFIADHHTQKQNGNGEQYQKPLLKTSLPHYLFLINTFNNSTVKNRILMLHKSKSKLMNSWKCSIIVPLLAVFTVTFTTKTIAQTPDQLSSSTVNDQQNILTFVITKNTKDAQLDVIATKLAEKDVVISFKNVKRNSKNELTSIKINYKYKNHKGNNYSKSSTPIAPIEVSFNPSNGAINVGQQVSGLSQTFELKTNDDGQLSIPKENEKYGNAFKDPATSPLIVVDGKEMPYQTIKNIDQNTIASMLVLKDDKAIKKYGDKGKNGVIVISLKEDSNTTAKGPSPIYILNGQEITAQEIEAINPNTIDAIDVLKNKKATAAYGEKGKNGVVIITLKDN